MEQSKLSLEELITFFENSLEDESELSNYFEYKYNVVKLQTVLNKACVIIDEFAVCHLRDGWFQVNLECEKLPPVENEDIYLFELDEFAVFSKVDLLHNISGKEEKLRKLRTQILSLG